MEERMRKTFIVLLVLFLIFPLAACQNQENPKVVIYVSVDQNYAEPILKQFEAESGIQVLAVYDVEATKTTGLVTRIIAEKDKPQADVFWSGEFLQTVLLKQEGTLEAYKPAHGDALGASFHDPDWQWTAIGGRARVLIVNTDLVKPEEMPNSIFDLVNPDFLPEKAALALPLFGTTATHASALYASLGEAEARAFFEKVLEMKVKVVDGNSVVKDQVSEGFLRFGLTDTDDACQAIQNGKPVTLVFPDQKADQLGTMVIPNSIAQVASGKNDVEAKKLIDYLSSPSTEQALVDSGWIQVPAFETTTLPECGGVHGLKVMALDFDQTFAVFEQVKAELTGLFLH